MKYTDKITIKDLDGEKITSFLSHTDLDTYPIHEYYKKCLPGYFQFLMDSLTKNDLPKSSILKIGLNLFSGIINKKELTRKKSKYTVDVERLPSDEEIKLKKSNDIKKRISNLISKIGKDTNLDKEDIEVLLRLFDERIK